MPPPELPLYRAKIEPDWIDYNGHLRDAYYGLVASLAIDDVMDHLGLDAAYRERTHCTLYTVEVHLHYLQEVRVPTISASSPRFWGSTASASRGLLIHLFATGARWRPPK